MEAMCQEDSELEAAFQDKFSEVFEQVSAWSGIRLRRDSTTSGIRLRRDSTTSWTLTGIACGGRTPDTLTRVRVRVRVRVTVQP